jgi:hypothetical protein
MIVAGELFSHRSFIAERSNLRIIVVFVATPAIAVSFHLTDNR